jgi:hypothetical protein
MSNQVPAHLNRLPPSHINDDLRSGLGFGSPPTISIDDQRFTLIDADGTKEPCQTFDPQMGPYCDIVIFDTNPNKSRVYYANPYQKGATTFNPPDCWSDNGVAPSANCARPMAPVCATCHFAEWGSEVSRFTGKDIPACREYKKIGAIYAGKLKDAEGEFYLNTLFQMRVPPNSHKHLRAYVEAVGKKTLGDRRLTVSDLITRVYFESQGTLRFKPAGFIDPELAAMRNAAWDEDAGAILVGRNDMPIPLEKQKALALQAPQESRQQETAVGAEANGQAPAASPAPASRSLSQRALAARGQGSAADHAQQRAQTHEREAIVAGQDTQGQKATGRPRTRAGKPKTVAPAPSQRLEDTYPDIPENLRRTNEASRDVAGQQAQEGREAAGGNFGVSESPEPPPAGMDAELDALFRS